MNRYTLLSFVGLLVIVIALPLYAMGEGTRLSQAEERLQAQSVQNGTVLYLEYCADCHGPTGSGLDLNPALNRLGMADADPDVLFKIIARAAHGSAMAAWHLEEGGFLNDHQIGELVTLIRFADWSQVGRNAAQNGLAMPGVPTREIADTSEAMLAEADPHQCVACHEDPPVHKGMFGLDCVRCHALDAWTPASLTRHTFQLDHGGAGTVACETCHQETYILNSCYGCHDHQPEQMVDLHQPEGIDEFENCTLCHPTGAEDEGRAIWDDFLEQNKKGELSSAWKDAE
jgi:mono/diheme cytochrome c family protein